MTDLQLLDLAGQRHRTHLQKAEQWLLVRRSSYTHDSERALLKEFRSRVGEQIAIEIAYCDAIDREPNGKFRAVKSDIDAHLGANTE